MPLVWFDDEFTLKMLGLFTSDSSFETLDNGVNVLLRVVLLIGVG